MYENQENQPPSRGCGVDVPQGGQRGGALKSKRGASLLKIPQVNSRGARILQLSNSNTPSLAGVYKVTGTLNFSLLFSGGLNLFPPILRHNLASRPLNIGKFCLDPPNKYFLLHF